MLTILDAAGMPHVIPRERLVSLSMTPPEPPRQTQNGGHTSFAAGDPEGTKARLVIHFDTGGTVPGALVFLFQDDQLVQKLKQTILTWATNDGPNQLFIDTTTRPTLPPSTEGINISNA